MKNGRSVWFINGNLTLDQAKGIATSATETLGYKSIPKDQIYQVRMLHLEEGRETALQIDLENPEEQNSALLSIFQDKYQPYDREEFVRHALVHSVVFQILDQPAFDYLRTKEQLGYIAYARPFNYRDMIGGGFIVQSSEKSAEFVISKINYFLNTFKEKLDNLSDEEYETAVNAVIMERKEIDVSLVAESIRLYRQIQKHTYQFDIKEREIEILQKMIDKSDEEHYKQSKKRIVRHFNNLFYGKVAEEEGEPTGNGSKLLNIELVSSKHKEDLQKDYDANTEQMTVKRTKITETDIAKFKNTSMLYPDRYMTRFADAKLE